MKSIHNPQALFFNCCIKKPTPCSDQSRQTAVHLSLSYLYIPCSTESLMTALDSLNNFCSTPYQYHVDFFLSNSLKGWRCAFTL